MAGVVQRGRLFAALLVFVTGVLLADMAGAETGQASDIINFNPRAEIIPPALANDIMRGSFFLGLVFSVKVVTAVIGRYWHDQPVRMRRFRVTLISAALFMAIYFTFDVIGLHSMSLCTDTYMQQFFKDSCDGQYWEIAYDLGRALVSVAPLGLVLWWLYVYKPPLKSRRFTAVAVVIALALGLLFQWDWGQFIGVRIYIGIVLILSPVLFYAGKEL